jgi:hypothetical protein
MGAASLLRRHIGLLLLLLLLAAGASGAAAQVVVDVGVILDRTTWVGNISWTSIELALDEFYADPRYAGYRTRLKLHLRDTGPDPIDAAAAGTYTAPLNPRNMEAVVELLFLFFSVALLKHRRNLLSGPSWALSH